MVDLEVQGLLTIQHQDLEVHDWLGNGSSGVVYQGIWRNPQGEQINVAIKKMKVYGKEVLDDICRELKMMQSVQCENICTVYGGCLVNNSEVWLIMEYIDGGDLHNYLLKNGLLAKDKQLSFFIQATKALHALHYGAPTVILHRDIKSLNFLVSNKTKLVLTDFGLSKAKANLHNSATFTIGTVRWAAPEIVTTNKPQWSEKADIYSLGMVFFEIVTGTLPYQEDSNLQSVLKRIKAGVPPKLPSSCPKEFAILIQSCLHPKPAKRPSTVELLADLERIANPQPNTEEERKETKTSNGFSLRASSEIFSSDFDTLFLKCSESFRAAKEYKRNINNDQLLDIFCLVEKVRNESEKGGFTVSNLDTLLWYLISRESYDLSLVKTFLCCSTSLSTPQLIFESLLALFLSTAGNMTSIAFQAMIVVRKKIANFVNLWLGILYKRDFHANTDLFPRVLNLIEELRKANMEIEANMLKLTLIRVNKRKLFGEEANTMIRVQRSNSANKNSPRPQMLSSPASLNPIPPQQQQNESKLLDWNIQEVAEQFTFIELALFKAVELRELSNLAWKSENPRRTALNIVNVLNRFDLVCQWASTEVVMAASPKQRASIIEKLILIAQKCYELRNYNSMMEILAGLNRASVQRLKQSWEVVSNSCQNTLKGLMEIFEIRNNYKTYREHLRKSSLPCIPFFGVFIRDLSSLESEYPAVEGESINFEKIYRISKIFKDVEKFQQSQYAIEEDQSLQPILRRLLAMPEEMLLKHSQSIESSLSTSPVSSPVSSPQRSPRMPRKGSVSSQSISATSIQ